LLLEKGLIGRKMESLPRLPFLAPRTHVMGGSTCSDVRSGEVVCAEDPIGNAVYRNKGNSRLSKIEETIDRGSGRDGSLN
jgi:hypothetical protein